MLPSASKVGLGKEADSVDSAGPSKEHNQDGLETRPEMRTQSDEAGDEVKPQIAAQKPKSSGSSGTSYVLLRTPSGILFLHSLHSNGSFFFFYPPIGPRFDEPGSSSSYRCCRHSVPRRRGKEESRCCGGRNRVPRKLEKLGFCPAWLKLTVRKDLRVAISVFNVHSHNLNAFFLRAPKRVRERMIALILQGMETKAILNDLYDFDERAIFLSREDVSRQSMFAGLYTCFALLQTQSANQSHTP